MQPTVTELEGKKRFALMLLQKPGDVQACAHELAKLGSRREDRRRAFAGDAAFAGYVLVGHAVVGDRRT